MKPARSLGRLAVCFSALSSSVAAWPAWLPHYEALVVRQDLVPVPPAPTRTPAPVATGVNTATRNLNTATISTDADGNLILPPTGSRSGNNTAPRPTEFNPVDPAANVVMVTPAAILGQQLYKIGDHVTWAWNYTNLQATPTAINVLVKCARATATWTLTSNMTFETMASYTWDTQEQATAVQSPLLTEQYTLIIYDADSSISATPAAGYLGAFSGFQFGMYTPQPYTPLNEWNCAVCTSGASGMDNKAVGMAVTMSVVTFLSFTWFVAGLGLW